MGVGVKAVSYTHLDVYKRQLCSCVFQCMHIRAFIRQKRYYVPPHLEKDNAFFRRESKRKNNSEKDTE